MEIDYEEWRTELFSAHNNVTPTIYNIFYDKHAFHCIECLRIDREKIKQKGKLQIQIDYFCVSERAHTEKFFFEYNNFSNLLDFVGKDTYRNKVNRVKVFVVCCLFFVRTRLMSVHITSLGLLLALPAMFRIIRVFVGPYQVSTVLTNSKFTGNGNDIINFIISPEDM